MPFQPLCNHALSFDQFFDGYLWQNKVLSLHSAQNSSMMNLKSGKYEKSKVVKLVPNKFSTNQKNTETAQQK